MPTRSERSDLWLRRFQPAPDASHRLLCLPHAGGSASYFFPVSKAMSPGVDVLAVQYPGRQDRRTEPSIESIAELADLLTDIVEPWTDKPLTLFGHSMGASVAFELALRLEARGIVPHGLFVSGRRAPSAYRDERLHQADDATLLAEIASLEGTSSQLMADVEVQRMVLPSIRSDYKAAETYRYEPGRKLAVPIHALIGAADPKATVDEVRPWSGCTEGPFELEVFPGGHFYLSAHAPTVIDRILAHLQRPVTVRA